MANWTIHEWLRSVMQGWHRACFEEGNNAWPEASHVPGVLYRFRFSDRCDSSAGTKFMDDKHCRSFQCVICLQVASLYESSIDSGTYLSRHRCVTAILSDSDRKACGNWKSHQGNNGGISMARDASSGARRHINGFGHKTGSRRCPSLELIALTSGAVGTPCVFHSCRASISRQGGPAFHPCWASPGQCGGTVTTSDGIGDTGQ